MKINKFFDKVTLKSYLYKNLSTNMSEKISDHISGYSKYLVTLSTSSIALTFAILQLLYKNTTIYHLKILRTSWYLFTATILFGLVFNFLDILRIFFQANEQRIIQNKKLEDLNKVDLEQWKNTWPVAHNVTRYSYLVLIFQTVVFFLSIIFLVAFLTLNF